jgi:hypothetical protein
VVHTPYTVESIREYVDTQESTTILDVHAPRTPFCVVLLCARILASAEYQTLSTVARRTTTVRALVMFNVYCLQIKRKTLYMWIGCVKLN